MTTSAFISVGKDTEYGRQRPTTTMSRCSRNQSSSAADSHVRSEPSGYSYPTTPKPQYFASVSPALLPRATTSIDWMSLDGFTTTALSMPRKVSWCSSMDDDDDSCMLPAAAVNGAAADSDDDESMWYDLNRGPLLPELSDCSVKTLTPRKPLLQMRQSSRQSMALDLFQL